MFFGKKRKFYKAMAEVEYELNKQVRPTIEAGIKALSQGQIDHAAKLFNQAAGKATELHFALSDWGRPSANRVPKDQYNEFKDYLDQILTGMVTCQTIAEHLRKGEIEEAMIIVSDIEGYMATLRSISRLL